MMRAEVEGCVCNVFASLTFGIDVDAATGAGRKGIVLSEEASPGWILFFFFAITVANYFQCNKPVSCKAWGCLEAF
jgi:hypothetical protein